MPVAVAPQAAPGLRLFVDPIGDSQVGARQLSDVRWSAVFDDVELTAADVPAWPPRLARSCDAHGKWVELDRVDLKEAAAALAEQRRRRASPAPRSCATPSGSRGRAWRSGLGRG